MTRFIIALTQGIAITLGVLYLWYFCLQSLVSYQSDTNDDMEKMVKYRNREVTFLQKRQHNNADSAERLRFIADLRDENLHAAALLTELGKTGIETIQWHRLQRKKNEVVLEGDASKQDDLVNFMQRVGQSGFFFQPVVTMLQSDTPHSFSLKIGLRT